MIIEKLPTNLFKVCEEAKGYILLTISESGDTEYAFSLPDLDIVLASQLYFCGELLLEALRGQFDILGD